MKVKDVVKSVLALIQNDGLYTKIDNLTECSSDELKELNFIVECINLTIQNIATNYVPLIAECKVNSNGEIPYSKISTNQIYNILSVKDEKNNNLQYLAKPLFVVTNAGDIVINYSYFPQTLAIDDNIECFTTKVNLRAILYGTMDEYLLAKGNFTESDIWNERFLIEMKSIISHKKHNNKYPARRWL